VEARAVGGNPAAMLPLDDPSWPGLNHAYGSAADIPELLRALASSPAPSGAEEEPWFSLWSSLCHQGDVYEASYAAVPHIVEIASNVPGPIDFSFFHLPAAIEIGRHNRRGPAVPAHLEAAYYAAIKRLTECVCLHLKKDADRDMLLSAFTAIAVAKGDHRTAEAISNLDDYWIDKINSFDFDE
jgi:hypothetical protein